MTDTRGSETEPDHFNDLDRVLTTAWQLLTHSAADRGAPTHIVMFVTRSVPGEWAGRHIVLRDCDPESRRLLFNTDRRSAKVRQLTTIASNCEVHLYDASGDIQLRVACSCTVHTQGPLFDRQWQRTAPPSRRVYQTTTSPGQAIGDPREVLADPIGTREGLDHFAAVEATVERLEWLYLGADNHRRAEFAWRDGALTNKRWLVP